MDLQLADKRALITGASRGLGYATARVLASEGAQVSINSRSANNVDAAAVKLAQESGRAAHGLPGDLTDPETPALVVKQAAQLMGGLDLLVTNTGGPKPGAFETLDESDWASAVQLNLMAHVRLIQAALPFLRASEAPAVLTITSYTVRQPLDNLMLSNSVRAATASLTNNLALELGRDGIRCNSILPGWTETDRVRYLLEERAVKNKRNYEEEYAQQAAEIPLGRMGRVDEFARVAVFLLSPAASYVTGTLVPVDGGIIRGFY